MNKREFFQQLSKGLSKLPHMEKLEILQDYEEYFEFGMRDGKSEQEIIAALGSPKQLSKELLATYHINRATSSSSPSNIVRAMWAVLALGFFNILIVLAPFCALMALIVSGWIVGVAFIFAPLLFLLNLILAFESFNLFEFFISIAMCGLGFFIIIGMFSATRSVNNGFLKYLKFNMRFVKGGIENE